MQYRARRSLLRDRALKPAEEQRMGWRSSPAPLICSSLWHSFALRVLTAMSHSCEDNEALKHAFTLIQSISSSTQRRALREKKKKNFLSNFASVFYLPLKQRWCGVKQLCCFICSLLIQVVVHHHHTAAWCVELHKKMCWIIEVKLWTRLHGGSKGGWNIL